MRATINETEISLLLGDITEIDCDAIVNAANSSLILGGGVAGAIRMKGGPVIQEECNRIGGTPTGTAAITVGGKLKAKYVIHAVGPIMGEGNEDEKLRSATLKSLEVADKNGIESIAFPAVSTGIFGYPVERCANVMIDAAINYSKGKTGIKKIYFCLYNEEIYREFEKALAKRIN